MNYLNSWVTIFLIFFYFSWSQGAQDFSAEKSKYETCRESIQMGDYKSPHLEKYCAQEYDMPSPFLQKCLLWLRDKSFPSVVDKKSCQFFCESNSNWGPWYDYEIPFADKENFLAMKLLHLHEKCLD